VVAGEEDRWPARKKREEAVFQDILDPRRLSLGFSRTNSILKLNPPLRNLIPLKIFTELIQPSLPIRSDPMSHHVRHVPQGEGDIEVGAKIARIDPNVPSGICGDQATNVIYISVEITGVEDPHTSSVAHHR